MAERDERTLQGRWVHSHEEDSDKEMVFRPPTYGFPPSRGRTSFELRPDGTYVKSSPGPVDAPQESSGHWTLEGDRLFLHAKGERTGHAWTVTGLDRDRLTVHRD